MKSLLTITFLLVCAFTEGQIQLLKKYDFDKGGYSLLGTLAESDYNKLADSLKEWYTDDIQVLNEFKKVWTFTKESPMYACGYHYWVCVCKDDECIESFSINLNCNVIATDIGYFYFDTEKLSRFQTKLKTPFSTREHFDDIRTARNYLKKISSDTTLILKPSAAWSKYEGTFDFVYKCKSGTKNCMDNTKLLIKQMESEIRKTYPHEDFYFEDVGGSQTEISVRVTCNKSLADRFKLYYRDLELDLYKWQPFTFDFQTYWTKENDSRQLPIDKIRSATSKTDNNKFLLWGGLLAIGCAIGTILYFRYRRVKNIK